MSNLLPPAIASASGISLLVSLAAMVTYLFVARRHRWTFLMGVCAWSENKEATR